MFAKNNIGPLIRELRTKARLTQKEVADSIGISKQQLSNIETGYRDATLDVLVLLSEYFMVPLDYLVGRIESIQNEQSKIPMISPAEKFLLFNFHKLSRSDQKRVEIFVTSLNQTSEQEKRK